MDKEAYKEELRKRAARQKQLDGIVNAAVACVKGRIRDSSPPISSHLFYGASAIHPKHLVTWYVFRNDSDLAAAREGGLTSAIDNFTREELERAGYPSEGLQLMKVAFTSDEDIQRTTGGDYWTYFK